MGEPADIVLRLIPTCQRNRRICTAVVICNFVCTTVCTTVVPLLKTMYYCIQSLRKQRNNYGYFCPLQKNANSRPFEKNFSAVNPSEHKQVFTCEKYSKGYQVFIHQAAQRRQQASPMSRFIKIATGLRDFGSDINANISKALNISKVMYSCTTRACILLLLSSHKKNVPISAQYQKGPEKSTHMR